MKTLAGLSLLSLRDVVVYPHMVTPLFVDREKPIGALEAAMAGDKQILLLAQKNPADDDPGEDGLYHVGTAITVLQLLKLPGGTVKMLVESEQRGQVERLIEEEGHIRAAVQVIDGANVDEREAEVFTRGLLGQFEQYVQLGKKAPAEVPFSLSSIDEPSRLVDTMVAYMALKIEQKQDILKITNLPSWVEHVLTLLDAEIDLLQVEKCIHGRVKKRMERSQREYYLNEQTKAIQKELGDIDEEYNEVEELKKRIDATGLTKEAHTKTTAELNRLKQMSSMPAEVTAVRSYIDWLLNVPWKAESKVRHDLTKAENILDADYRSLEEVKERILEYLAMQKWVKKFKGPVLCPVGPPGVGKTFLAESIARAANRKFVCMAPSGMRDETGIRGYCRTYIGFTPDRLIQKMTKVGVRNPLSLPDETDKMGSNMRGDPTSALFEVLNPERNYNFNDRYPEADYDSSDVMFLCTASSMNILALLLDRMEVIRLSSYTEDEKVNIASGHLIPKQVQANGLKKGELTPEEGVLRDIIRYHTREAGVHSLGRQVAKVCRKAVKEHAKLKCIQAVVSSETLENYFGARKFRYDLAEQQDQVGQATELAWTQIDGELLTIEVTMAPGKGQLTKTGPLGGVMAESITVVLTVVRSRAQSLGIAAGFHEKHDIHIHVPEGATPKDGSSAGIDMCTALVSATTQIPVRADVAMTGEIILCGQVLAIGGLKEKLLAAHRGGIKTVITPEGNACDLKEIPDNIKSDLVIKPVRWIDEVLQIALQYAPEPLPDAASEMVAKDEKREPGSKERISTYQSIGIPDAVSGSLL